MSDNIMWCPRCNCNRNVDRINWVIFIILLILGVIFGLIYLVYCLFAKEGKCAVCGLEEHQMNMRRDGYAYEERYNADVFCTSCGTRMNAGNQFCPSCGRKR